MSLPYTLAYDGSVNYKNWLNEIDHIAKINQTFRTKCVVWPKHVNFGFVILVWSISSLLIYIALAMLRFTKERGFFLLLLLVLFCVRQYRYRIKGNLKGISGSSFPFCPIKFWIFQILAFSQIYPCKSNHNGNMFSFNVYSHENQIPSGVGIQIIDLNAFQVSIKFLGSAIWPRVFR